MTVGEDPLHWGKIHDMGGRTMSLGDPGKIYDIGGDEP